MKKILVICPYFGKLPVNQINLWLKTCECNKHIDFVIITDDKTKFDLPQNVKIIIKSFNEIKEKIQSKFDFKISLDTPYKLCDFKPCYGYLFDDLVNGYDYWGHNDISDSFFGDFEGLINNFLKENPLKIGYLGHLTLYKNSIKNNTLFFHAFNYGIDLKKILGSSSIEVFDELYRNSINTIFRNEGINIINIDNLIFDIGTKTKSFMLYKRGPNGERISLKRYGIIEWNKGKLYLNYIENDSIKKNELVYVHYQKRKIDFNLDISKCDHFILVPDMIIPCDIVDINLIKKYTSKRYIRFSYIKNTFKLYMNLFKKKLKIKEK